ncbi:MAG: hypothetical protein AAFN78_20680 [Pseudomonadota bacterium]
MATQTRRIGLSLGADICWPICYEEIMRQLGPITMPDGGKIKFDVERVAITPYSLTQPCQYDVVIDRLTHWYHTSREWIKKSILLDDLYVFNNPWSLQSMEKQTSYAAMMRLGLPVPETWMLPPKAYEPSDDLEATLKRYARLFDLGEIGEKIGYPFFMKPYSGGGWVGVTRIANEEDLVKAYDESGTMVMNLQKAVAPYDSFVRCVGLGPQVRIVNYKPDAPLHDRYGMETDFVSEDDASLLRDMTLTINSFFGWDFNSCEALRSEGVWYPIDFANACPDSQVTSVHFHFPWLIMANIRWSTFCASVKKPVRHNLAFSDYFAVADKDLPYRERLSAYADIARKHFMQDQFEEYCEKQLGHLDEIAWEFFQSDTARDAVRQKVEALFPDHEHESFTDLFWERIQSAREHATGSA